MLSVGFLGKVLLSILDLSILPSELTILNVCFLVPTAQLFFICEMSGGGCLASLCTSMFWQGSFFRDSMKPPFGFLPEDASVAGLKRWKGLLEHRISYSESIIMKKS